MREWLSTLWDYFVVLSSIFCAIGAVILCLSLFVNHMNRLTCISESNLMGRKYSYGMNQGCMVEAEPNKWYPITQVYYIERGNNK